MTKPRSNLPLRIAGLAAGLVLAASLLAFWRVDSPSGELGAEVRILTIASGELRAAPTGVFLSARELRPGGEPASGTLRLRNVTPVDADVVFEPNASDRALGRTARLELRSGGRVAVRGTLARLNGSVRIPANSVRSVEARVWVPRGAPAAGWEARFADVNLGPRVRYVREKR